MGRESRQMQRICAVNQKIVIAQLSGNALIPMELLIGMVENM